MKNKELFYHYYNTIFTAKEYSHEYNYIIQNWEMFGQKISNPKILDVGCGTGKHTFEFIKNGYEIIGIDIDRKMIDIASYEYGNEKKKFKLADITKIKFDIKFDLVFSYFFVINYINDLDYLRKFFISIYKLIEVGGIYSFDIVNGNATCCSPPVEKKIEISNNCVKVNGKLVPSYDSKFNSASYHYSFEVIENNKKINFEYSILQVYWNPFILVQLLKKIGFKDIYIFKHLSFDDNFSSQDYKLSFVCIK